MLVQLTEVPEGLDLSAPLQMDENSFAKGTKDLREKYALSPHNHRRERQKRNLDVPKSFASKRSTASSIDSRELRMHTRSPFSSAFVAPQSIQPFEFSFWSDQKQCSRKLKATSTFQNNIFSQCANFRR